MEEDHKSSLDMAVTKLGRPIGSGRWGPRRVTSYRLRPSTIRWIRENGGADYLEELALKQIKVD